LWRICSPARSSDARGDVVTQHTGHPAVVTLVLVFGWRGAAAVLGRALTADERVIVRDAFARRIKPLPRREP
jgi:hypothetical protein